MKKDKIYWLKIGILLIAFAGITICSFTVFFHRNAERVEQTNLYYLEQDSGRLAGQIETQLRNSRNYLRNIASIFADSSIENLDEMRILLEKMAEESPFDNLYFTYPDGTSYRFTGENRNVYDREYFQRALNGEAGITEPFISRMTGREIIVFYQPIQKNGDTCAVLLGVLFTDNIAEKLKTTFMDESVYSAIITEDGQILVGSNAKLDGKNLIEEMENWEILGEDSVESMKQNMAERKSGLLTYRGLEDTSMVIYRPLGENSWYIIQNLPSAVLSNMKGAINTAAVYLAIALTCGFFVLFLAIYLWLRKRHSDLYVINQRFAAIVASSYNLIMEYDEREKTTKWYGDSEKIFMTDPDHMDLHDIMNDETREVFRQHIQNLRDGKEGAVELQLKGRNDKIVWCNCRFLAIRNLSGEIIRILCIIRNIDEQKKKEFALISEKERMEEAYRLELEKALEEAREANRVKSSFLEYISHDLRTPMNAVIGMNRLSAKALEEDNVESARYYIERTYSSADYLMSLISGILEMAHFQKKKITLKEEIFSWESVVESCQDFFNYIAKKQQITLKIENEVTGGYLGDYMRICQILNNLIENAVKYNKPDGRVELQITAGQQEREIQKIQIVVSDTGIGMNRAQMDRLFEPFSRGTLITSQVESGTGIGLAIVKHIVDAMEGEIQIESELNQGTTVKLSFPVRRARDEKFELPQPHKKTEEITVLVVDDIEINLEIAATLIEGAGYRILTAQSGREALELYENSEENTIDILLTDISMPEMDGFELAERIRQSQREDAGKVYIIALSAYDYEESRERAEGSGMNAFINKPFELKQFIKIVKTGYEMQFLE
ncbi:MAG: ATP-binding protein [Lachnospiraceae bacterium]|nr:ATP-binding protein [Lachnospiraceae bacterium]